MKVEVDVLGSPSLIVVVVGRFYIALFSRSRADSLRSHVFPHE